ncbi:MAG: dihydrolipoamide acetyltransferase family protein [Solirubrobacteraceae bacterium]
MPTVLLPSLAEGMKEGTILEWLVESGTEVSPGEDLVEIETDKASVVYAAEAAGSFTVIAAAGSTVSVGAPIAVIGEPDASHAVVPPTLPAAASEASSDARRPAERAVRQRRDPPRRGGASPVARRLAQEQGVDLTRIAGTGPRGRVVKSDVLAAMDASPGDAAAGPADRPSRGEVTVEQASRMQELVAQRMTESRASVPDFALTVEIDMSDAVELRESLKAADAPSIVPSLNDLVVKACAVALREHPRVNGEYADGTFRLHERVNVGVAVAAPDGLVVPTVDDADALTLGAIARTTRRLIDRVRTGAITPVELTGATFTVSNLGMFAIDQFDAIINAPQAAILAVGSLAPRAVVRSGSVVARPTVRVTLCSDHRIVNGADGAAFLSRVQELLESPIRLLVG